MKDRIIGKSVHSSDGVLIGNIHDIDKDSVVVKGNIVSTVYYHIPMRKVKEWDGHALWLTIDYKESKMHLLTSQSRTVDAWTDSIDLELDNYTLSDIAMEAERHGISPTNYINQIIKRYLEWDKFEPKAEVVPISKPVAKELFGNLSEQQIISMAEGMAKNALPNIVLRFVSEQQKQTQEQQIGGGAEGENGKGKKRHKQLDMNSFLSWLENEMNSYAIEIRHIISKKDDDTAANNNNNNNNNSDNSSSDSRSNRQHIYILKHGIGYNYSLYYKTLLDSIFKEILQKNISIKITSAIVTFEFEHEV